MIIGKADFKALSTMFEDAGDDDEIEAVYGGHATYDVIMRILRYMRSLRGAFLGQEETLDVSVAAAALALDDEHAKDRLTFFGGLDEYRPFLQAGTLVRDHGNKVKLTRKIKVSGLSLPEYSIRINRKTETDLPVTRHALAAMDAALGKLFRMKRRYSFSMGLFRMDVTAVRQLRTGAAVPTMEQLMAASEHYELEIEYVGNGKSVPPVPIAAAPFGKGGGVVKKDARAAARVTDTAARDADAAARELLSNCDMLLQLVDDTSHVMSASEKRTVTDEYLVLAGLDDGGGGAVADRQRQRHHMKPHVNPRRARSFIGPDPASTLTLRNLYPTHQSIVGEVSVRSDYTVTDKADGERRLLFVSKAGRVYTFDRRMEPRDTGLAVAASSTWTSCILDGEHVRSSRPPTFACFDAYFVSGRDVRARPLMVPMQGDRDDAVANPQGRKKKGATKKGGGADGIGDGSGGRKDAAETSGPGPASRLQAVRGVVDAITTAATSSSSSSILTGPNNASKGYRVMVKDFQPISGGNDLFLAVKKLIAKRDAGGYPYEVDGLIFTPMKLAVGADAPGDPPRLPGGGRWSSTIKWKPPHQNTIDFRVTLRPADELVVRSSASTLYRVADLLVGYADTDGAPVTAMAFLTGAASGAASHRLRRQKDKANSYVERAFKVPGTADLLHVAYLKLADGAMRCANGDQIFDGSIVEFAYATKPAPSPSTNETSVGGEQPEVNASAPGVKGWGKSDGYGVGATAAAAVEKSPAVRHDPYNWLPLRVRFDKMAANQTANRIDTALSTWSSIVHPVTEALLTGAEPLPAEPPPIDKYYVANVGVNEGSTVGMRRFHNIWVKNWVMLRFGKNSDYKTRSLFDFGVGRAADLHRWCDMRLDRVMGIDKFASNLTDPVGGAYARVVRRKTQQPDAYLPRVAFVPMDASRPIDTAAIMAMDDTDGDRTVAQVLWGEVKHPRLSSYFGFALGGFDMATCMFAVHYFFDTMEHLRIFAENVSAVLRNRGGLFVGMCLDGASVHALLEREGQGGGHEGQEGGQGKEGKGKDENASSGGGQVTVEGRGGPDGNQLLWKIVRKFEGKRPWSSKATDNIGMRIEVFMETIGQSIDEYLVDWNLLVHVMAEVGLRPLPKDRCRAAGIGEEPTGLFSDLFSALQRDEVGSRKDPQLAAARSAALAMSNDEKRYSFLNRWFVFTKD